MSRVQQPQSSGPVNEYIELLARAYIGSLPTPEPPPGLRWDLLISRLLAHRTLTTFSPMLLTATVPADAKAEMTQYSRLLRRKNAYLLLELARVLPPLEESGLRPVVLKGPALATTVYTRPEERIFVDLDILVKRRALTKACELLRRLGYEERRRDTWRTAAFYDSRHFHRVLSNPAGVTLELHWDMSRPEDYYRFEVDRFRDNCRLVDLDRGQSARVPSDADQLLHAACQMVQSGFADLRRVLDAALLVGAGATTDPDLAARATRQGMATALWMLFLIVESITGVAPPTPLRRALAPPRPRRTCIASLDVSNRALSLFARDRAGYKTLVRLLGSPDLASLAATARRFLLPDAATLADAGHDPAEVARPLRRGLLVLQRWVSFAKLCGFQLFRLAAHAMRKLRAGD